MEVAFRIKCACCNRKTCYRETEYINTVEPANNGRPRDWSKWPLCTGDRYRQVGYNMGSLVGIYYRWQLCAGGRYIE